MRDMVTIKATHEISEDGLTMRSRAELTRGTFTSTLSWTDPDTALENYEKAMIGFEKKAEEVERGELRMDPGERKRVRRFSLLGHEFTVLVETGPPTWWLPNAKIALHGDSDWRFVRAGWLRAGVTVRF